MKRPHKTLSLLLALGLALSSCSNPQTQPNPETDPDKPKVLATFTVLADMAQAIAGDDIQVDSLTKPGAEIHGYEPTPSDVRKAAQADLILANGLNLEAWLDQFLQDSQAPSVTVSDGIKPIPISEDAGAGAPNPHAWMSPTAAQTYIDNIAAAFSQLDPAHTQGYQQRADNYKKQLAEIQEQLTNSLAHLPADQRLLVTCEGAFSYLAADAGLDEAYLWAVNSDGETGARRIRQLIDTVRDQQVPAVFCESTVSNRAMQQVASDGGAHYAGALYVDSLSEAGGPVPTYLDLIRYDTQLIADSLSKGK